MSLSRVDHILPGVPRVLKPWQYSSQEIQEADVLLWEPHDRIGEAIASRTNGPFCHASIVGKAWGTLWQGGYHFVGSGSVTLLRREVQNYSGKISVFRVDEELTQAERHAFASYAMNSLSGKYAMEDIALNALISTGLGRFLILFPPLHRWYVDRVRRQSRKKASADCSQNVARAAREALQLTLVPCKPEALISPNDLARSNKLKYVCTLTWGWPK